MDETTQNQLNDIAIKVDHVSKNFKLPHDKSTSIKSVLINTVNQRRGYEMQQALKDVSFEIKKGEFFGIVGRNGSGKSTLLKTIAGIYTPTEGEIKVSGSLAPFIELGVGFNPELTGRENVFLNGALLGFNRKQMMAMYKEIVDFAELERFMDQKLKNYSSGMQVRLAFSIAIRAKADILLLDEVLAVGDSAFQRKCLDYFRDIKATDRTVVLVTHSMATIEEYCDRGIMLDDGQIVVAGSPLNISLRYELANSPTAIENEKALAQNKRPKAPPIKISKITLRSSSGLTDRFKLSDDIYVDVEFDTKKPQPIYLKLNLFSDEGEQLAGINSIVNINKFMPPRGRQTLTCHLEPGQIPKGIYQISIVVYADNDRTPEMIDIVSPDYGIKVPKLIITEKSPDKNGKFLIAGRWFVPEAKPKA